MISAEVAKEMYEALKVAHYEALCLEPRLTGLYRNSMRAVKERCAAAIAAYEKEPQP